MTSGRFWGMTAAALTAAAVYDQARRPPNERTWHGRVAGVPYDFRRPTLDEALEKLWNPDNPSICAPTLFGVGWSINLYRLAHPFET